MSNPKQIPAGTRFGRLTTISHVYLKADTNGPWSHVQYWLYGSGSIRSRWP